MNDSHRSGHAGAIPDGSEQASAIAGVVLCGGQSVRMGQPKHLLPWAGRTLLEYSIERLQPVCNPILIVAAINQPLPLVAENIIVVRDSVPFEGPLAGLISGLSALPARCEAAFVTACDSPFLTKEVIARCLELWDGSQAAVIRTGRQRQPLMALYQTSIIAEARRLFDTGVRRLSDLLECLSVQELSDREFGDLVTGELLALNLNSPADYAAAMSRLHGSHQGSNLLIPPPETTNQ